MKKNGPMTPVKGKTDELFSALFHRPSCLILTGMMSVHKN